MMSPKRGTVPTGLISSPVGMIATTGRRATVTVTCPPAAAAARSPGRSRRPAGTRGCPAPKSSPAVRTFRPRAAWPVRCPSPGPPPAAVMTTLPSACGSRRSRTITVSALAGIGSPVSIHSNKPAGSRTAWPSAGSSPADPGDSDGACRGEVGRAHRDPVHGRAVGARRRPPGHDRRGGDPPERLADRDPLAVPPVARAPVPVPRPSVPRSPAAGQPARTSESSHRSRATRGTGRTPPSTGLTARPRYGLAPASCR